MPYFPFDTGWIKFTCGIFMISWFIISRGLCTPTFMFNLFYSTVYGPMMGLIFKAIGLFMTTVGTAAICIESAIFNKFNYIDPIYDALNHIGSILPSIRSCPRPMYSSASPKGRGRNNNNNNKPSGGRYLGKYFALKRIRSRMTVISPGPLYYTSSH
jgi:hypothetical protein